MRGRCLARPHREVVIRIVFQQLTCLQHLSYANVFSSVNVGRFYDTLKSQRCSPTRLTLLETLSKRVGTIYSQKISL
jgi:hypothetical protein